MKWFYKYLNLPYKNHNCFEFIVMIMNKEFGLTIGNLPKYETSLNGMNKQIIEHKLDYVEPEKINQPVTGDVVLMHSNREMNHVGLFIHSNGVDYVIHCMKGFGFSMLHKIRDLDKHGLNLEGYYRWRK